MDAIIGLVFIFLVFFPAKKILAEYKMNRAAAERLGIEMLTGMSWDEKKALKICFLLALLGLILLSQIISAEKLLIGLSYIKS